MEALFAIVFTVFFLIAAAIVLFLLTVHPIWGIIDVAISPDKTTGEKVVWIILMFFLWSFGSLLYGLIFGTRPLAITTRVLVAVLLVLIIIMIAVAIVAPLTVDQLRDRIRSRRSDDSDEVTPEPSIAPSLPIAFVIFS